jgi:hypothetical protein
MKRKIIVALIAISMMLVTTTAVMAVKPTGNPGAETVPWNLSGAVMPLPWGQSDIPGSDSASKLIVNQPNGNVEVVVTGVMNGLTPDTVYTVYPSNAWSTHWDITGDWVLDFDYLGHLYIHDMTVTDNTFTGYGSAQFSAQTWTVAGIITGDDISMTIDYDGSSYYVDVVGTIASDGTMSGTWGNLGQSGTWCSSSGNAVMVGNGWPRLFPGQGTFTFTTDEYGTGSWHFNLKNDDFPGPGDYALSIWINKSGRTILISNNFEVVVD